LNSRHMVAIVEVSGGHAAALTDVETEVCLSSRTVDLAAAGDLRNAATQFEVVSSIATRYPDRERVCITIVVDPISGTTESSGKANASLCWSNTVSDDGVRVIRCVTGERGQRWTSATIDK